MVDSQEDYVATPEQRQVDGLFRKIVYEDADTDLISSYFETYSDRFEWGKEEATRNFFANAGWIANSHLDFDSEKNQVFKQIKRALSKEISMKQWWGDIMTSKNGGLGEPAYYGVPETELREAYENMEPYP
ncbi:MAG: hypothetical protein R6V35_01685 [Candidatus Nanohaloarchaea archaeon]